VPVSVFLAGADHADLILSAHPDVFDTSPDPQLTRDFLSAPHLHIALAVEGGMVIGMCSGIVYHHPDKHPQWWINELGVAGPWRRNGIATELVRTCAAEAARLGCTEIWVVADPTDMAERFYLSLGWARTGTRLAMFSCALPTPV
jgi:GNAT superfamily N-acetyltransferase